jgi:hypothetical protein
LLATNTTVRPETASGAPNYDAITEHIRGTPVDQDGNPTAWDERTTGMLFTFELENTTGVDITIPQDVRIMKAGGTGILDSSPLKLRESYFIPARHSVALTLENSDLCSPTSDPEQCFDAHFQGDAAIVIFDESRRLEIRIPMPPALWTVK